MGINILLSITYKINISNYLCELYNTSPINKEIKIIDYR